MFIIEVLCEHFNIVTPVIITIIYELNSDFKNNYFDPIPAVQSFCLTINAGKYI